MTGQMRGGRDKTAVGTGTRASQYTSLGLRSRECEGQPCFGMPASCHNAAPRTHLQLRQRLRALRLVLLHRRLQKHARRLSAPTLQRRPVRGDTAGWTGGTGTRALQCNSLGFRSRGMFGSAGVLTRPAGCSEHLGTNRALGSQRSSISLTLWDAISCRKAAPLSPLACSSTSAMPTLCWSSWPSPPPPTSCSSRHRASASATSDAASPAAAALSSAAATRARSASTWKWDFNRVLENATWVSKGSLKSQQGFQKGTNNSNSSGSSKGCLTFTGGAPPWPPSPPPGPAASAAAALPRHDPPPPPPPPPVSREQLRQLLARALRCATGTSIGTNTERGAVGGCVGLGSGLKRVLEWWLPLVSPSPSLELRDPLCLPHRPSNCLSHCVSLTVSRTVAPSPSLELSLPLCLPYRLSNRLSHCVSLTVSRTVSPTVSPSPSLELSLPLCLPHRPSNCLSRDPLCLPHRLSNRLPLCLPRRLSRCAGFRARTCREKSSVSCSPVRCVTAAISVAVAAAAAWAPRSAAAT
jgi:hypothetical protein